MVATRHFCNKIWNAAKFVISQTVSTKQQPELDQQYPPDYLLSISPSFISSNNNNNATPITSYPLVDRWILSKLATTIINCEKGFNEFDFFLVTSSIHSFFLYDFCDVYLEYSKPILYQKFPSWSPQMYRVSELNHFIISTSFIDPITHNSHE